MFQPMCPLHMYERVWCGDECAGARRELIRLNADYRQFWCDRRRGVRPAKQLYAVRDRRPVWLAWRPA